MRLVKRAFVSLLVLLAILVAVGFILPERAHLERSVSINAPASAIFPKVNNLKAFNEWAPWHGRDPQTVYKYEGPDAGVGCKVTWQSDHPEVGNGTQIITESEPDTWVKTELDFGAQGKATAYFQLVEQDGRTDVTWGFDTMFGSNIISRYFGLLLESMLGPDYESGLSNLKRVVESEQ